MDAESFLTTSAQIGIGIAGFSGIAAALGRRGEGAWTPQDITRMRILLRGSFGAVLASLLPVALAATPLAEATRWSVSSALYAAWIALSVMILLREWRRLVGLSAAPTSRYATLIYGLALLSLVLNLANLAIFRTAWPYLFSLLLTLTIAFVQFVRIVSELWRPPEAAG